MTQRILVTGATGDIGGRLVPRLLERGDTVREFRRVRADCSQEALFAAPTACPASSTGGPSTPCT
ncbi:hypothetical protein OT109_13980 [Phycisphaeraceae bacterium D3-23]